MKTLAAVAFTVSAPLFAGAGAGTALWQQSKWLEAQQAQLAQAQAAFTQQLADRTTQQDNYWRQMLDTQKEQVALSQQQVVNSDRLVTMANERAAAAAAVAQRQRSTDNAFFQATGRGR